MSAPRGIPFRWWHEVVLMVLLLALLLVAGSLIPNYLDWKNQLYLSRHLWEFAILALGMTLIIITGGIDLSVGSAMGLCAVAFGISFEATQSLAVASAGPVLLVGLAGGSLNGLLVARFKVHPLIVTLATYAAFRGIAEGCEPGKVVLTIRRRLRHAGPRQPVGRSLSRLSVRVPGCRLRRLSCRGRQAVASFMPWDTTSRRPGFRVSSSIASSLGSMPSRVCWLDWRRSFTFPRFNTAKADTGKGFELDVITAVVVGGTSIFGGRGNIVGTTLGLLLIHETRLFVSRYWGIEELKPIVIGSLLIVSVLAYRAVTKQQRE